MMKSSKYPWFILILAALTSGIVIGVPTTSLAVLFKEISSDLHLDLFQMGLVWSIGALLAIITSPLSGALDDRFGPKRVMIAGILLVSMTAGMRGLANGFVPLLLIIILVGGLVPLVTTSAYKITGIWFPPARLGMANGILAMGMAFGSLLGALLSATVLSPVLGGWRHVLFFYAGLSALFSIPWIFTRPAPAADPGKPALVTVPMGRALVHIVKLKNVWLLGISFLGIAGCVQGVAGYLPLYLRGMGWSGTNADGALSFLNAMSMIFILPIMFWADRRKNKKWGLAAMILLIATGTGWLSFADGLAAWGAIALVGMLRDASAALLITMVIETDGVGPVYAGTASGFMMFFFFAGNLLAPPAGNLLADRAAGLPFVFWGGLVALGILSLTFSKTPFAAEQSVVPANDG
jgi:cyanate permease